MVVLAYHPSTWDSWMEDQEFKASHIKLEATLGCMKSWGDDSVDKVLGMHM